MAKSRVEDTMRPACPTCGAAIAIRLDSKAVRGALYPCGVDGCDGAIKLGFTAAAVFTILGVPQPGTVDGEKPEGSD